MAPAPLAAAVPEAPVAAPAPAPPAPPSPPAVDVEALLAGMTLEQKVGQLMMVGFGGLEVDAQIAALVKGREVGGVCLFKRNISTAAQVAQLNDQVRALLDGRVPPFIAVDQEGGNVVRVSDGNLVLPGNMVLGATRSAELTFEAGRAQALDLKRLGFNMNLAPVLDVNVNPFNPVIGLRAFGDDVGLVSELGAAFVRGQQSAGLVTVAKHFPGHGTVDADSHLALPVVRAPAKAIREQFEPFTAAMREGLDGLMTAHVAAPALSGDETPATLSTRVLTGVLREELGFKGLVLTDELEMDAIAHRYGVGRAAVMAVNAGADMVLVPWRVEKKTEVWESLLEAARSGELPMSRVNQAVRRVLRTKERRGVFEAPPPREERLLGLGGERALAGTIAAAGVTLLKFDERRFPPEKAARVLVVSMESSLAEAVARRAPKTTSFLVSPLASEPVRQAAMREVARLAASADVVVVGVLNQRQVELVDTAAQAGKPVVAVVFGSPYLAAQLARATTVMAAYSYRESMTEAAVAALFGERPTPGRLPVKAGRFPFGSGLDPVGARATAAQRVAATAGAP